MSGFILRPGLETQDDQVPIIDGVNSRLEKAALPILSSVARLKKFLFCKFLLLVQADSESGARLPC
ncbi:MAG: hypothetical protein ABIL68_16815 [bacterium]